MEVEAAVQESRNGVEKQAPAPGVGAAAEPKGFELVALLEKREKMLQGLNSVKAEREALKEQLVQAEEGVKRTEGALIMLNSLIQELDPTALQPQAGR